MTQGFLIGIGLFGGLLAASLILNYIVEIGRAVLLIVGIIGAAALLSFFGFAKLAEVGALGLGALLIMAGIGYLVAITSMKTQKWWARKAIGSQQMRAPSANT